MRTVWSVAGVHVDMQIFISLQRLLEKLDLLVALDAPSFRICSTLPISIIRIEAHQFLDPVLVLLFHAQLEGKLRKHQLKSRTKILRVGLD